MLKTSDYIVIGGMVLLLLLCEYVGYTIYPKVHPCPEHTSDTLYVYDTVEHHIIDTVPYYIVKTDTVIYRDTVFKDVDTAEILKDYFALHVYERLWLDSTLKVTLLDTISQNKPQGNTFTYQLLKPQTNVTNVTNIYNYTRYITAGLDIPLKDFSYVNLEILYVSPKWYGGVGYNINLKTPTLKAGVTIKKLK